MFWDQIWIWIILRAILISIVAVVWFIDIITNGIMTLHAWMDSVYHDVNRSGVTRCQQRRHSSLGHLFWTERTHVKHESLKTPIKQNSRQTVPNGVITMFSTRIDSIRPINFQSLFGFLFIPMANHIPLWDCPSTSIRTVRGEDFSDVFSIYLSILLPTFYCFIPDWIKQGSN